MAPARVYAHFQSWHGYAYSTVNEVIETLFRNEKMYTEQTHRGANGLHLRTVRHIVFKRISAAVLLSWLFFWAIKSQDNS
jgi:hypothetical protein